MHKTILSDIRKAYIYTIILLIIYFAMRAGRRKKAQLEKMNIQDLS